MKPNNKIIFEILLVIAAIIVFIYKFTIQRKIAYMASIIAVVGTVLVLIKDIKKNGR